MSKHNDKRIKQLYLINMQSHFVTLLQLLAQNKLLVVSGTIVSVQDCLDKIKNNLKSSVESNSDQFLSFIFNQTAISHTRLQKYQRQSESLKTSLEALRKQFSHGQKNPQKIDNNLSSYLMDEDQVNHSQISNTSRSVINQLRQVQITLRQQLSFKQKQIKKNQSTITDLTIQIQSLNQLIKRLQAQNNNSTSKLFQSLQQNEQLQSKLNSPPQQPIQQTLFKKQSLRLQTQNHRLQNQISLLHEKIKYLQIKSQDVQQISTQQVNQLKVLGQQRLRQLNKSKIFSTELEQKNTDLMLQNNELKKQIEELRQKNFVLVRQLNEKLEISEQIQQSIAKLEEHNDKLSEEIIKQKEQYVIKIERLEEEKEQILVTYRKKQQQQPDLSKFMAMLNSLKQKQLKKQCLVKKALVKVLGKCGKIKQSFTLVRQEVKGKMGKQFKFMEIVLEKQIRGMKEKFFGFRKMKEEKQYERHMGLLRQVDMIRKQVERKEEKVGEQENRILERIKKENQRGLNKVRSYDNLRYGVEFLNRL